MFAIITENDESAWDDTTGELYHFPMRYLHLLQSGTKVIYYKGGLKNQKFANRRLTRVPHYFGIGTVGKNWKDNASEKNDYYCEILDFHMFEKPVEAKIGDHYIEIVPLSRENNYWRDGVRIIDESVYSTILNLSGIAIEVNNIDFNDNEQGSDESLTSLEGKKKERYTTTYERDSKLRSRALRIHGYSCMACGFNFEKTYGSYGVGYIHVHHIKPISEAGIREVDPKEDMVVLCANCHSMIHRKKNRTLSLDELKVIIHSALTT